MKDAGTVLSLLWIAHVFHAAYGDITTLYFRVFINSTPVVHYTQAFLVFGLVLVEPAILVIVLSRVYRYQINRSVNIVMSGVLAAIQAATLSVETPAFA